MSDLARSLQSAETWDAEMLEAAVPLVTPPPALRARLLSRLAQYCATGPITELRQNEGAWVPTGIPGVDQRMLYTDPATRYSTYYLRFAPGAVVPPHRHKTNEQCLVMEGDLYWDDLSYGPGDFVVAAANTLHSPISSKDGALVLIVSG